MDRVILQPKDPWSLHVYWELTAETIARGMELLQAGGGEPQLIHRLFEEGAAWFDIPIKNPVSHGFLQARPGRAWRLEVGLKNNSGKFLSLARSNTVKTPPARSSQKTDSRWGDLPALWERWKEFSSESAALPSS